LTPRAIRQQVVSSVNLIVQVERQRDGGRRVTQVTEIAGIEGETQLLNDIFKLEITGESATGRLTDVMMSADPFHLHRAPAILRAGARLDERFGRQLMESQKLLFVLALAVILLLGIGVASMLLVKEHERTEKLKARLLNAMDPVARPTQAATEEYSLVRTVSRSEQFWERVAGFIGVDMQQAETYPIKWWLVPPIAVLLDAGLIFLLSHPLASYPFLLYITEYFGSVVFWYVLTRFIFNMFTNRRNTKLIEQFPDALNTIVRCVRVGIPMGEALRTVAKDSMEPTKLEFSIVADKVSIGVPLDVALRELSLRIKLTEYQFFATALTLQARAGGGITQTLEGLSDVIRKRVGCGRAALRSPPRRAPQPWCSRCCPSWPAV